AKSYTLYAVSLISAILAMKTKEISFTLPIIIALYEFMFFEGKSKRRILYLLPLLLTLLIIPLGLIGTDKPIGDAIGELREASQEGEEIPRWSYLFTQFRVIVTYVRLLFLPINQNLDYDYPLYHSFSNPLVFLSFLFLLSICGLGVYLFYRSRHNLTSPPFANPPSPPFDKGGMGGFPDFRLISFGIFWFFITLSVESGIIPIRDVIFEHRVYLPSVGAITAFSMAVFYVFHFIIQRSRISTSYFSLPTSYFFLLSSIVIVLSIATYERNIIWQDRVSLWEDVVSKSPKKVRGHINLGVAYDDKGLTDKAIEKYQIALGIKPDYAEAHINLGVAYNNKGLSDKAVEEYRIALGIKPDYAEAYYNLGIAYKDKGLTDKAIEEYRIALRLKPDYAKAHNNIGNAYSNKGWIDKAIEHYQIALKLRPDDVEAHNNLAVAYVSKGLTDKAIEHFQISLNLKPDCADVHFNLGKIYLEKGFIDKAHKELEKVLLIKPNDYEARQFLNYISNLNKIDSLGIR
ncbi:MAG: tetratricopeptide repeat protein, partial [Planctomycetota bacterium]